MENVYLKKYKPTSPGRRFQSALIVRNTPGVKIPNNLIVGLTKTGGRNNLGRITTRHKGGGHKRRYRIIDFKRDKRNIPARVIGIFYDPNRTVNIALVCYKDGEKRFILCPQNLKVGDYVISGENVEIKEGNALPLKHIPLGTFVHNIELLPNKGGQIARAAGCAAQIVAKEGKYALLKMPSGELRKIHQECYATVGILGNEEWRNVNIGKAGRNRYRGIRPTVRGVAMNPVDHPHGGGEGKTSGGRHPVSPWGMPTKGYKTRKNKRSDVFIVKRRR